GFRRVFAFDSSRPASGCPARSGCRSSGAWHVAAVRTGQPVVVGSEVSQPSLWAALAVNSTSWPRSGCGLCSAHTNDHRKRGSGVRRIRRMPARGDGPVGADEGEPLRIGFELVKGVLLAEVVTAGIQRQAEVIGESAGPSVYLGGRAGGGEGEL